MAQSHFLGHLIRYEFLEDEFGSTISDISQIGKKALNKGPFWSIGVLLWLENVFGTRFLCSCVFETSKQQLASL